MCKSKFPKRKRVQKYTEYQKIGRAHELLSQAISMADGKSTKQSSKFANILTKIQYDRAWRLGLYKRFVSLKEWNEIFNNQNL